jgi:hypothetical protein
VTTRLQLQHHRHQQVVKKAATCQQHLRLQKKPQKVILLRRQLQ